MLGSEQANELAERTGSTCAQGGNECLAPVIVNVQIELASLIVKAQIELDQVQASANEQAESGDRMLGVPEVEVDTQAGCSDSIK